MSLRLQIRFFLSWLGSVYLLALATTSQAAEMALADAPLFLGTQIDPNIFFMLDDSGSMDWEVLTSDYEYYSDYWSSSSTVGTITTGYFRTYSSAGTCTGTRNYAYIWSTSTNTDNVYNSCSYAELEEQPQAEQRDWRIRSSDVNIMYYNPSVTYSPWDGFSDATFTNVRSNPQPGTAGYTQTLSLVGFVYQVWVDNLGYDNDDSGGTVEGPNSVTDGANGQVDLWDSHTQYTVDNAGNVNVETYTTTFAGVDGSPDCDLADAQDTPPYVDCFGTVVASSSFNGTTEDPWGRTVSEIKTNIANWYEFHRRRSFVSKAAITQVVNDNDGFRFGLSQINRYDLVFEEVPGEAVDDYTTHNAALLQAMYQYEWQSNGTPLRRGLERVGRYYSDYYAAYTNPIISACQQNYSVLFTDGYWNGSAPYTAAIADEDGDGAIDTVADVAHYFYTEDLSPLADDVPVTPIDPNNKQHMVSFTVAFGVEGNMVDTDDDNYPTPELAEDGEWNDGNVNSDQEKIDDLWHAAFNSKAYYVSAQSTDGVADAISAALLEIADRVGSAASVATNTGSLNAGSHLFQARFDSADWKGQLLAFSINADGTIDPVPDWEAGDQVNSQNYDSGREIITWNPDIDSPVGGDVEGQGVPFRFPSDYTAPAAAEINADQVENLLTNAPFDIATVDAGEIAANQTFGDDILNYLRGDTTNEGSGQSFRNRNSVLGDIVNSDPKFVAEPNNRYSDDIETVSYDAFVSANASRDGVVYVGANDGMLHAFSEANGSELLAYVPGVVYENLDELADADYIHRYFVDAGPNIVDVFFPNTGASGTWKTALVGGLAGGGQGIYALDVTDPSLFNESNAASLALWEFDDGDDADLGYTYGRPQLAKMADGSWAAVFGNGYNNTEADGNASSTGHAVLYIVDIESGDLLKKIDTEAGAAGTPNGLATPLLIDEDGDFVVDYIYAGDLLGNMWKFDVTSTNKANWDVAYDTGGVPDPLFTAEAGQPITSQPQASFHPDNLDGFMIYFGTGHYLETTDNDPAGNTTQAFYGIWDKNEANLTAFDSTDLLDQYISNQYTQSFDTDGDGSDDEDYILRDVTDNDIDFTADMGWKLEFLPVLVEGVANVSNFGERQVSNAIIRNGRIIFTTLVPSSVECEFGGMSFLMELDFRDGSALEFPAFDLNNDGEYDADDSDASGRTSDVGIMPTVSILAGGAQDVAFGSGASGDIDVISLSVGGEAYGRQSWRQLE